MASLPSLVAAPPDGADRLRGLPLFAGLAPSIVEGVAAEAEWLEVPGGAVVFRQGEPADGLYVVVTGRLRVLADDERTLSELGRGEPVGELGLLVDEPRSATVLAVRDSLLIRITTGAFERLADEAPKTLLPLTRIVARRLVDAQAGRRASSPITPVAMLCLLEPGAKAAFLDGLLAELRKTSAAALLTAEGFAPGGGDDDASLAVAVDTADEAGEVLLLDVGAGASDWASACLRQAARVVVVASATDRVGLGSAAEVLAPLDGAGLRRTEELVLLHPPGRSLPAGTARWLALRPFAGHHHLRQGSGGDRARLARHLLGRSVGLVLGGGGARAFAHIGAYRALLEAATPIDLVGGSSLGAVMAAQVAAGWTPEAMHGVNRREWQRARINRRYTVPLVSLLSVRTATPMFERMFGEADLEDLWLPCFATTADLSSCRLVAQRRGSAARWVRASASPPGIWPPVLDDEGQLHVDGGVLDNLPVQLMRGGQVGRIATVNVSPYTAMAYDDVGAVPTTPGAWLRALSRARSAVALPNIVRILYRTAIVTSLGVQARARALSDLYVQPELSAYGLTDYGVIDRIVATGEAEARARVAEVDPPSSTWA